MWSDFQYGFRSSLPTEVVSDKNARAFNSSGATRAVVLDISKAFDRVWYAGLPHSLTSYGISGQIFGLIFSFLSNRWLRVVLDGKSSQEYPVNARFLQGSILGPTHSCYPLMTFLMMISVILLSMVMILLSTLNVIRLLIRGNRSDRSDRSKSCGAIDVKMDGSILEKKTSFKMLGLTFSSKLDWGFCIISITKTVFESFYEISFS